MGVIRFLGQAKQAAHDAAAEVCWAAAASASWTQLGVTWRDNLRAHPGRQRSFGWWLMVGADLL
jgi:hypothetical protein